MGDTPPETASAAAAMGETPTEIAAAAATMAGEHEEDNDLRLSPMEQYEPSHDVEQPMLVGHHIL